MKLPVFKQMHYVSPSSFNSHQSCEFLTYLARLAGYKEFLQDKQGIAAAIGTAFDLFIKDKIERELSLPRNPELNLAYMLKTRIDEEHREVAEKTGRKIAKAYIACGLLEPILKFRGDVHVDVELRTIHLGVPIFGILDLALDDLPLDWKTRGFSKSSAYPKKGWVKRWDWDLETGSLKNRDENPKPDKYHLEKVNPIWAIQMLFYNWCLGRKQKHYVLEEICHHNDIISFARHEGSISEEFETSISEKLVVMWDNITGQMYYAEIEEPSPSKWTCEKFGFICKAAHLCKYYENTLGREDRRGDYE